LVLPIVLPVESSIVTSWAIEPGLVKSIVSSTALGLTFFSSKASPLGLASMA
jgi:hypothetical protein